MRWADDLRKHIGSRWVNHAADGEEWKRLEEAYVQRWVVSLSLPCIYHHA